MTRHDDDGGNVGVAIYFAPLANERVSRVPDPYWCTVSERETRLPSGYVGLSYARPSHEYFWFRCIRGSKLDNELCALLGLTMSEDRK